MIYHDISKTPFLLQKHAITAFLSWKFMITRSSIVFENLLASSIAPQVMPHWLKYQTVWHGEYLYLLHLHHFVESLSLCDYIKNLSEKSCINWWMDHQPLMMTVLHLTVFGSLAVLTCGSEIIKPIPLSFTFINPQLWYFVSSSKCDSSTCY